MMPPLLPSRTPPPRLPLLHLPLSHLPLSHLPPPSWRLPPLLHLPLLLHLRRLRPRCRHRRPTPTLQAQLPARPPSPRTSLRLPMLSPATLPPPTVTMRRSARCNMCTRTKESFHTFGSVVRYTYRQEGKIFRGQDVRGNRVGKHENIYDMQLAVIGITALFTTHTQ